MPGAKLRHPVQGNEIFVDLPGPTAHAMSLAGAKYYPWPEGGYRFVCSWTTPDDAVDRLLSVLKEAGL